MKPIFTLVLLALSFLTACQDSSSKNQTALRVAFDREPQTLDPRLGTDLQTANVLQMMYEGLMRLDYHGNVIAGIAETMDVSSDQKTYTFTLRESFWSDGTPLTANDFEETWMSILDPAFPAPNAYQFYDIKGAKAYKTGKGSKADVGIKALNSKILVVELENPTPYFSKLVSTFFFLPAGPKVRHAKAIENAEIQSNGPFKLDLWKHNDEIVMVKNPLYWDAKIVSLDQINLIILDENTSYKMFEMGQLDRTGSPTATLPQDAIASLRQQQQLKVKPAAATHWFRFNTEVAPINNAKMRRAFNLALNRQAIVEHVTQGNQTVALGLIPPLEGWETNSYYKDNDPNSARLLFQEALQEMNIEKKTFPVLTLAYAISDRNHKIAQAVQQQWNETFGIHIQLLSQEPKIFSENVLKGNYQIVLGSWYADFSDPINFLEIFKFKSNASNRTQWEHPEYIQLLDHSATESDNKKRLQYLKQAEAFLMEEMLVAPLFFASFNYLESDNTGGVSLSELGILDFKYAYIEDESEM